MGLEIYDNNIQKQKNEFSNFLEKVNTSSVIPSYINDMTKEELFLFSLYLLRMQFVKAECIMKKTMETSSECALIQNDIIRTATLLGSSENRSEFFKFLTEMIEKFNKLYLSNIDLYSNVHIGLLGDIHLYLNDGPDRDLLNRIKTNLDTHNITTNSKF